MCPFCGTVTALSPHGSDDCMASAVTLTLTSPITHTHTQILFILTNKPTVNSTAKKIVVYNSATITAELSVLVKSWCYLIPTKMSPQK